MTTLKQKLNLTVEALITLICLEHLAVAVVCMTWRSWALALLFPLLLLLGSYLNAHERRKRHGKSL